MVNEASVSQSEVDGYYDQIHKQTWRRRVSGMLAAATLFGACGAVGGAVAAFLPAALGALGIAGVAVAATLPSLAVVLSTAALFATVTGAIGMVIGSDVGANSAAAAAQLEIEKKESFRNSSHSGAGGKNTEEAKAPRLINWKTAAIFAGLFAVAGVVTAVNPVTSGVVVSALHLTAASTAAKVATGVMFGMFGGSLGINFPLITNKLSNFYSDLLKGEPVRESAANQLSLQPAAGKMGADSVPFINEAERQPRSFADNTKRFTIENVLDRSDDRGAAQDQGLTR